MHNKILYGQRARKVYGSVFNGQMGAGLSPSSSSTTSASVSASPSAAAVVKPLQERKMAATQKEERDEDLVLALEGLGICDQDHTVKEKEKDGRRRVTKGLREGDGNAGSKTRRKGRGGGKRKKIDVEVDEEEDKENASQDIAPEEQKQKTHPRGRRQRDDGAYADHCRQLLSFSDYGILDFATWTDELTSHFSICKIAEASFGEVYQLSLLESLPEISPSDESVIKVIALTPPNSLLPKDKRKRAAARKNTEGMSSPADVATEIHLLQRMTAIPGFTNFRDVRIVQGRPPAAFAEAFYSFAAAQVARGKEPSVFPDPGDEQSYAADQLWAVVEMQHAGTDLERYVEDGACTSIWSVWDVFWQTTLALAKGEEGAEFEHRDLHLGNICIRHLSPPLPPPSRSPRKKKTSPHSQIDTQLKLNFTNIEATLIDYTLSRAAMAGASGAVAHVDLARDESLFTADSTDEYQYEIYRYMRGAVLLDSPRADFSRLAIQREAKTRLRTGQRSWAQFHPRTNLLWLHYVLVELLAQVHWPSEEAAPRRGGKAGQLSAAVRKRAKELEKVLLLVQERLDPETVCSADGLLGAGDLVALALGNAWLDVADVVGEVPEEVISISHVVHEEVAEKSIVGTTREEDVESHDLLSPGKKPRSRKGS